METVPILAYEGFYNKVRTVLANPMSLQWTYAETRASDVVQTYKIRQDAFKGESFT